jgi:hypothetical protein
MTSEDSVSYVDLLKPVLDRLDLEMLEDSSRPLPSFKCRSRKTFNIENIVSAVDTPPSEREPSLRRIDYGNDNSPVYCFKILDES